MPRRPSPMNGTTPLLLVPVFKKGNPSMCTNYRGIALISTYAKLYNRLLLGHIRDGLDNHLRQNQNGFFLFAPLVNKSLRGAEYMKMLSPLRTPALYPPLSTSPQPSTRWTGGISRRIFYSPLMSQSKRSMRLCPSITGLLQE